MRFGFRIDLKSVGIPAAATGPATKIIYLTLEPVPEFTLRLMEDDLTDQRFWRAGEIARESGVSTDTLRHYERKKVLAKPRRGANGYRMYPDGTLERVQLVRRALAVGFTLDELALILGEFDKGGAPCRQVHKLATEKLQKVEDQIENLMVLRDDLRRTLADWDERLSASADGTRSKLLESLPAPRSSKGLSILTPNSRRKKEGYK